MKLTVDKVRALIVGASNPENVLVTTEAPACEFSTNWWVRAEHPLLPSWWPMGREALSDVPIPVTCSTT